MTLSDVKNYLSSFFWGEQKYVNTVEDIEKRVLNFSEKKLEDTMDELVENNYSDIFVIYSIFICQISVDLCSRPQTFFEKIKGNVEERCEILSRISHKYKCCDVYLFCFAGNFNFLVNYMKETKLQKRLDPLYGFIGEEDQNKYRWTDGPEQIAELIRNNFIVIDSADDIKHAYLVAFIKKSDIDLFDMLLTHVFTRIYAEHFSSLIEDKDFDRKQYTSLFYEQKSIYNQKIIENIVEKCSHHFFDNISEFLIKDYPIKGFPYVRIFDDRTTVYTAVGTDFVRYLSKKLRKSFIDDYGVVYIRDSRINYKGKESLFFVLKKVLDTVDVLKARHQNETEKIKEAVNKESSSKKRNWLSLIPGIFSQITQKQKVLKEEDVPHGTILSHDELFPGVSRTSPTEIETIINKQTSVGRKSIEKQILDSIDEQI